MRNLLHYNECPTNTKFLVQAMDMPCGIGTHIDAPKHCFQNGLSISDLPLSSLIRSAGVINVSSRSHALYSISLADILSFETDYTPIIEGMFIMFYTGWDQFWHDPERYRNHYHFPTLSEEAARYLLSKDISGIGIDTLSPDKPESGYPVHQLILGANKYIVENIANLKQMPPIGGQVFIIPLAIAEGTESPIRLFGCTL